MWITRKWEDCGMVLCNRIDGCRVVSGTCPTCVMDKVWEWWIYPLINYTNFNTILHEPDFGVWVNVWVNVWVKVGGKDLNMRFLYEPHQRVVVIWITRLFKNIQWFQYAVVTELVDVLVSGTSFRKGVGVRVSPTAPHFRFYNQQIIL